MRPRLVCSVIFSLACVLGAAAPASASQMITRNANYPSIKVGTLRRQKVAVVTYASGGSWHHALAWGAINARTYSTVRRQVAFEVNFSGGYGSVFGANAWKRIRNACAPDGELKRSLPLAVAACTMRGNPREHWALQRWQRLLPNAGVHPSAFQRAYELHLSHWTDAYMPVLWLKWSWANAWPQIHYDHLYGVFSFDGHRVYGHASTRTGSPTDTYGRNIYVDTVNPVWTRDGAYTQPGGWVRFNGFLTHYPRGDFCASVYKKNLGVTRPGYDAGALFRATSMGPGVTPIVRWQGPPPGYYSAGGFGLPPDFSLAPSSLARLALPVGYSDAEAQELNDEQRTIAGPADACYKVYGPHS